jgi:hypothetical protein
MDMYDPRLKTRRGRVAAPPDPRRAFRLTVEIEVKLSGSNVGRQTAELRDLSVTGCRIACVSNYPVGTTVIITIPGLAPIGAQVRWSDVAFCGLRFNAPMHPLVVERVVARASART